MHLLTLIPEEEEGKGVWVVGGGWKRRMSAPKRKKKGKIKGKKKRKKGKKGKKRKKEEFRLIRKRKVNDDRGISQYDVGNLVVWVIDQSTVKSLSCILYLRGVITPTKQQSYGCLRVV